MHHKLQCCECTYKYANIVYSFTEAPLLIIKKLKGVNILVALKFIAH